MTKKVDKELQSAKLNIETGLIAWDELARHFARGVVIRVHPDLDLVDVGQAFLSDDAAAVDGWRQSKQLNRASDDDARRWHAESAEFWALVVAPWVLVQEVEKSADSKSPADQTQLH